MMAFTETEDRECLFLKPMHTSRKHRGNGDAKHFGTGAEVAASFPMK